MEDLQLLFDTVLDIFKTSFSIFGFTLSFYDVFLFSLFFYILLRFIFSFIGGGKD